MIWHEFNYNRPQLSMQQRLRYEDENNSDFIYEEFYNIEDTDFYYNWEEEDCLFNLKTALE